MPTCSGCGAPFEANAQFCPYCGREKPIEAPQKAQLDTKLINACPICKRNDKVEKVSVIYTVGTHDTSMQVPITDINTDSNGKVYSTTRHETINGLNQTRLAQMLRPPTKPNPPSSPSKLSYGLVGFFLFVFSVGYCQYSIEERVYVCLAIGLLISIVALVLMVRNYKKSKKEYEKQVEKYLSTTLPAWENTINRWNSLYFCHRDGNVFIPDMMNSKPVDRINEILYQ